MSGKLTRRTSHDPMRDTQRVIKAIKDSAEQLPSDERRAFLRKALTAGAATFVGGAFAGLSNKANAFVDKAQRPDLMKAPYPPGIPPWTRTLGPGVTAAPYGKPSQYEKDVIRRDVSWLAPTTQSSVNFTPLQSMHSIITPNGLHFERDHAGHPNINPAEHRLLIHGMVDRPMLFSMDDLMRYPSVQKTYFIECAANGAMEWHRAQLNSLQYTHGMISTAMWTGVPLSTLLGDTGLKKGAKWLLIEGADGAAMTRSLPLDKGLDDCLIAWGQNGEMCRPENGYPLRIVVPGWEGNINVKWLRRIKVGDKPWWTREETSEYSDMLPDGKARASPSSRA
jgi:sulfur dehydrogenase subunit SoxC (EC 1.-.-.-)